MENQQININNWNYCHYEMNDLKAIITFGANPESDFESTDPYEYYVTLLDKEHKEKFQMRFSSIELACEHINQKYADYWKFKDNTQASDTGGCSTCVAH